MFLQPPEIKFHLAFIGGLKVFEFKVNDDEPFKFAVVEQQVDVVVFAVDDDAVLATDECEARTEFKNKSL